MAIELTNQFITIIGESATNNVSSSNLLSLLVDQELSEMGKIKQERNARRRAAQERGAILSNLDADQLPLLSPQLQDFEHVIRGLGHK